MMEQKRQTPAQAYEIGEIVDYKVRTLFANYSELIDEKTDITAYLHGTAKLVLFRGQTVKCRVLAVSEKHPKIELVDISAFEQSNDNLTEEKLAELLASRGITWNTKDFVRLLLTEEKEKSFESQCHRWIQGLLNKRIDIQTVRHDCSGLLELSDLLNICSYNERDLYQERLTFIIEQTGYYIRAAELIEHEATREDTAGQFIDDLFNKLRISGFVYHPNKNFNILSALFLRRPDLMNARMRELLDIIGGRDIHIWEREPFSSALIKLLELYIRECDGRIDKTKDNRELIDNNMLALAIQLLLIKDTNSTSIADYRLNAARLCLVSSYLYPLSPERLVNAAYYNLFHSSARLPAYSPDGVRMLPHYIAGTPCGNIDTVNSFSQGNGRLLISEKGIHLLTAGVKESLRPVFPKEIGLWKGLQVFLSSKTETSLASVKSNDIGPYQSVWAEIESEFFNVNKNPVVVDNKNRRQHRIDDTVRITFTSQDVSNRNKYYCQIEDEIGGTGFIYVSDIVGYSIATSLRHFYASDGSRLVFQAQIIDKEDNQLHFSMLDDLKNYFSDGYYSYDEDIICSVGSAPNSNGMAPAITKEGVSVSIKNASALGGIGKNSIVRCRLIGPGIGNFHITCEATDFASYDFDLITAFRNLMEDCSVGRISESITEQEEEQILESDKLMDEAYVREVIYMIDRMALIDAEYVKSYNYLGFARILCLMIGWESQAAYYKGRMDIITMLHDFAQNSKVDENRLAQLENANADLFSNNVVLKDRFMQLQTVSFIDREEHNADLIRLATDNPALKNLASLVLAYNITRANKLESSAINIHNKIIQLLNLKGYETGLKQYGSGEETEETEYKTSFVFAANDSSGLPNPEKQKDEILKVIDSFFNTRGGTLYIGVNNFGYGVGVEEDLNTAPYFGDKEKYVRSVVDAVALEWGNSVATTYIRRIGFDEENTDKDVLIIDILPIEAGLAYRNEWYVRKAGSKRRLSEIQFNEYQRVSRRLQAAPAAVETPLATPVGGQETVSPTAPLITSKEDEIRTSRIRKNIVADYMDYENYVEPVAFFKFLGNSKFKKLSNYDYDDQSLLTLTVLDHETKNSLILGYDNGHVAKVSVEELLDYTEREYSRYSGAKLIFASIATEDDLILTISKENKTHPKAVMRADSLARFCEERLMDSGEIKFSENLASETLAFEVIPAQFKEDFVGLLDKKDSFVGYPDNAVTHGLVRKLRDWGITEI